MKRCNETQPTPHQSSKRQDRIFKSEVNVQMSAYAILQRPRLQWASISIDRRARGGRLMTRVDAVSNPRRLAIGKMNW